MLAAAAVCILAVGGSWPAPADAVTAARVRLAFSRARLALSDVHALPVRVSGPERALDRAIASAFPSTRTQAQRLGLAMTLHELASSVRGDTAAHARGTADLLVGNFERAAHHFDEIRLRTAAHWNDLAAANICAARQDGRPEQWLSALTAADNALALDAGLIEARFNRASILDALGIVPIARDQWARYVALDGDSPWSAVARTRIASFAKSDAETWREATAQLEKLTDVELAQLTDRYPQAARRYADVVYLSRWASALIEGDVQRAGTELARVRAIARTLTRRGEPLLEDAVAAIDRASSDPPRLQHLADGQLRYQDGRLKLREGNAVEAEKALREADRLMRDGNSPIALVVEFWIASALTEQQRADDARRILVSLLTYRYPSLRGHVQYQLSLLESWRGNWSASLAAARESAAAFKALGERGNLGNANAMLSENYDLLGQAVLAREHGFAALRESSSDGALDRTRVALAGLCRTELRGKRWHAALSLARLESELASAAPDARMEPDLFIRKAAAERHLTGDAAAARSMSRAREAAMRAPNTAMRTKLLADVMAAEGTFVRRRDPRRAITLLSSAVRFQEQVARPIILPELYLQRGRAHLALNDLASAERDFDAGIAELERQRTRVSETELRPGIFEDAAELFDEAVSLQLQRGADPDRVMWYVERGRARAVLEEIHARDEPLVLPRVATIGEIQQALPASAALLEYVLLPDRMVVIAIAAERATMHVIAVPHAVVVRAAQTFIERRGADGGALHDLLITPVGKDLHGIAAINIVPDDALQRIPFAALFERATQTFLIERYAVATSPSAGVFLATLNRSSHPPRPPSDALVFANPTIPRDQFPTLPSLGAASSEAVAISRNYSRTNVLTSDLATAEQFIRLAPDRDVVHFAGHGVTNEREPHASALVCAATPRHPGALTAREIARIPFRSTRVVILSACSTMTGRNAAIEGVPSLSRAFIVAGVPAVIGTLWDIEDKSAAAITAPLHRFLASGMSPGEAMRSAQIDAIRRRRPTSEWSAFALMGTATQTAAAAAKVTGRHARPRPPLPPSRRHRVRRAGGTRRHDGGRGRAASRVTV